MERYVDLRVFYYAAGFIGLVFSASEADLFPVLLTLGLMIGPSALRLCRELSREPSGMVCPNCGSRAVFISCRFVGAEEETEIELRRSLLLPRHRASVEQRHSSSLRHERVARCCSCGFDYPYITAEDLRQPRAAAVRSAFWAVTAAALAVYLGVIRP